MDIDRTIRESEAAARAAEKKKERDAAEAARHVQILLDAFDDFRAALIRHSIEPRPVVSLVPVVRGFETG